MDVFIYIYTSWGPVLEQDITMYEMSPSCSRSFVHFHSLSFTHSLTHTGFSTTVDIARSICMGFESR